jgi:hypothetical protein
VYAVVWTAYASLSATPPTPLMDVERTDSPQRLWKLVLETKREITHIKVFLDNLH